MAYNKTKEENKWKEWKLVEEKLLRQYGVSERTILELHEYDWAMFNAERRFLQRQFTNIDNIEYIGSYEMVIPIYDIETLMDQLDSEHLYFFLNTLDKELFFRNTPC